MRLLFSPMVTNSPDAAVERLGDHAASPAPRDAWGALMEAAQNGHGGAYRRLLTDLSPWL